MKNVQSSRPLTIVVAGSAAISAALIWFLFDSFAKSREALVQGLRLVELGGVITHYDEVLTMSARMGAATGDESWEARYLTYETRLDAAIAEVRVVSSKRAELEAAGLTEEANERLVALEKAAFAFVRAGEPTKAGALLSSDQYELEKKRYAEGMDRMQIFVRAKAARRVDEERKRLLASIGAIVGFLVLLSVSLFLVRNAEARVYALRLHAARSVQESEAARLEAMGQSEKLKSTLLLSLAHDFRTPLAVLETSLEAARDPTMSNETRQELLDASREELEHLDLFTSNLLELSRLEAGTFKAQRTWHLLEDLLEEVLRRRDLRSASRRARVHGSMSTPPLHVDGLQIQHVLKNLLENAEKYGSTDAAIDIAIASDGRWVSLSVENAGVSLDPDEHGRVFEKFFRGRSARARGGRGSGLGLAISKGIIEAHGGTIEMSHEGSNTKVTFKLPVDGAEADPVLDSPPGPPTPPDGLTPPNRSRIGNPPQTR